MKTRGCVHFVVGVLLLTGCGPTPREFHRFGLHHYYQGDYVDAIAMFRGSLEQGPERPDSQYYLGECYRQIARKKVAAGEMPAAMRYFDQALLRYNKAIDSHPAHAPALRAKSDVLAGKGKIDESLATARWAGEHLGNIERGARFYVDWGRRLEDQRDYDSAKLRFDQAVAVARNDAWVHVQLGAFYQRLGDTGRATAAYREAYRLDPFEPGVTRALAALGAYPAEAVTAAAPTDD